MQTLNLPIFSRNPTLNAYKQVEGEAQGDEDSVQSLLNDINKGPRMAHIVKVEKKEVETRGDEDGFTCGATSASTF